MANLNGNGVLMLQQDEDGAHPSAHLRHRHVVIHNRQLRLEWAEREGRLCLEVRGWTKSELLGLEGSDAGELSRRLALYTGEALAEGGDFPAVPPVAGRFEIADGSVRFVPRFPFADGVSYSLLVDSGGGRKVWKIIRETRAPRIHGGSAGDLSHRRRTAAQSAQDLRSFFRADERGLGGRGP